jgi:hypothetical protein
LTHVLRPFHRAESSSQLRWLAAAAHVEPWAPEQRLIVAMQQPKFHTPEAVLRGYFHAKDENRPHLLEDVFSPNAELLVRNQSASIAFPPLTRGRPAIAEVLVRSCALSYENVYSFYLGRPLPSVREFTCPWLVGMSERSSGEVRVGCGTYEWAFELHAPHTARRLVVDIEAMQVLPATESTRVFAWLRALNYPWSSARDASRGLPANELLSPIAQFLSRHVAVGSSEGCGNIGSTRPAK